MKNLRVVATAFMGATVLVGCSPNFGTEQQSIKGDYEVIDNGTVKLGEAECKLYTVTGGVLDYSRRMAICENKSGTTTSTTESCGKGCTKSDSVFSPN
jgi:hypothetical protein